MDLRQRIQHAINETSAENGSNTPDYVLANFLMGCLTAFDAAVNARHNRAVMQSAAPPPAKCYRCLHTPHDCPLHVGAK